MTDFQDAGGLLDWDVPILIAKSHDVSIHELQELPSEMGLFIRSRAAR